MQIETRLMDQLSSYLDLASDETKLTAANMANIDTPGYQAVGMDFTREMQKAIQDVDAGAAAEPVDVEKVDGLVSRPDGNDVSMDREGLNLAEAQLRYKTGIALWRDEFQRVMDAIHANA
ncbi:MAG TPA: flagellar biosynthesis protein FlgB [Terracidiphilus sp.]|nr:flagellar biosynthesis protein FlgB [Terracidiphilus sp.]